MKKILTFLALSVLSLGQAGIRQGIDCSVLDPACKPCEDFHRYATMRSRVRLSGRRMPIWSVRERSSTIFDASRDR